jgi:hypothetical protein
MTTEHGGYNYCFIIAYGRSGSTLLQGVLNGIEGYLIRGENGGILNVMYRIARTAANVKEKFSPLAGSVSQPWYGIDLVDRAQLLADLRQLFIRNFIHPSPGHRCLGCKEIRYGPDSVRSLTGLVDFIDEAFPNSCFIFNSRNLEDVAVSAWWKQMSDPAHYLATFEKRMREVYDRGRSNYFWVHYNDYVADPETLGSLFQFLGEPFNRDSIGEVLRTPHNVPV